MRPSLVLFALLAAPLAVAQLVDVVEVTVIEVPVTVRGRDGSAMRHLTAQNFEVLVDGAKVPVEYFEVVDLAKITSAERAPAAAHRNFLLLFDVANSQPGTIGRAKEAARTFVESQLRDRDVAAVATFTAEKGATMVTAFSRDRKLLLAAIDTLGAAQYFKVMDPLLLSANYTESLGNERGSAASGGQGARASALATMQEEMRDFNDRSAIASDAEMRTRIRTQLQNFGAVARAFDRLRGQKQIILLSEGFDASLLTGREDVSFDATREENARVESGEIWHVDSEKRFGGAAEAQGVNAMTELFRRSDVRLHAIDIRGVRGSTDVRDGLAAKSNDALFILTRPTGGSVFENTNDLKSQFDRLLEEQDVIYLLGFKARPQKAGQFHPVRVKLVGTKGEVSHRAGYYDRSSGMSNLEATLRFSELLTTGTEVRDVPLSVTAFAAPGDDDSARVPVIVDASGTQLFQDVEGNAVHANIFVYAFNDKGEAVDFLQQRIVLDVAKTGEAVRATGVRYVGGMRLPPGDYSVKALVRVDETGRMGLTTTKISVPKYGATAVLPPVAMGEMGKWVTVVSPLRGSEATGLLTLERPFLPLTSGAAPLDIALLVRGMATDNLAVTPSLVGADGTAHKVALELAGRTEPDEHGVAKLLFRMPAQALAKGDYELRFTVAGSTVVKLPVVIR